jgi:hypothetical protein
VWLLSGTNALDSGTVLTDFGTLEIAGSIVNGGVVDIATGGRLTLENGATGAGGIAFVGSDGTLETRSRSAVCRMRAAPATSPPVQLEPISSTSRISRLTRRLPVRRSSRSSSPILTMVRQRRGAADRRRDDAGGPDRRVCPG